MRPLLTLALAALLVPALGGDEAKDKASRAKPVVVPFEMLDSGHMAVQVKVNGKGPYRLIFDTGAPISLVNNKLAKDSGLSKGMAKPAFSLFGGVGEATIKTLEVGGAKAQDVPAVVMDHPTVDLIAKRLDKDIYGIVGFPFFARYKMTLDYKAKTMTLSPSGYKPPDVMKAMNAALMTAFVGQPVPRVLAPQTQWGIVASKEEGDDEDGVDVKNVVAGSAAEKAGLKRGDRLLTLDGRWTDSLEDLFEAAERVKAGTSVVARVKRGDKEIDLKVTPVKGM